jgi:hypothetical protein
VSKLDLRSIEYIVSVGSDNKRLPSVPKDLFDRFSPEVLGLGDISVESVPVSTIAAVFDLGGFTQFCSQGEPNLIIPDFMSGFVNWVFESLREETMESEKEGMIRLWHPLPILVKFLGDGLLILWDTKGMNPRLQHNLILSLLMICYDYRETFYGKMAQQVPDPPKTMRCGIAKGTVYSIGDKADYVGPCINLASRLQKLEGISFAFSRKGFAPEKYWEEKGLSNWILRKVHIRGLSSNELIYLLQEEYDVLDPVLKEQYLSPT